MSISDNGKMQSPTDMAKYSTLTKITIFRGILRTDYLRIMVFFLPKISSMKVNSNMEWPGAKVNILKDPKPLKVNLNKITPHEIASKRDKIILSSGTMKMALGAREN
jgi:hypothetical protein